MRIVSKRPAPIRSQLFVSPVYICCRALHPPLGIFHSLLASGRCMPQSDRCFTHGENGTPTPALKANSRGLSASSPRFHNPSNLNFQIDTVTPNQLPTNILSPNPDIRPPLDFLVGSEEFSDPTTVYSR